MTVKLKEIKMDASKLKQYRSQSKNSNIIRGQDNVSGYESIVLATDQDLDGYHIRGLMLGFFQRYIPEALECISMLQTPVICVSKKDVPQRWYYDLDDDPIIKKGELSSYKKGLGSWDTEDLKYIVKKDGLDKMIQDLEFDTPEMLEEWLGKDSAPRKKYILENNFSIAKL